MAPAGSPGHARRIGTSKPVVGGARRPGWPRRNPSTSGEEVPRRQYLTVMPSFVNHSPAAGSLRCPEAAEIVHLVRLSARLVPGWYPEFDATQSDPGSFHRSVSSGKRTNESRDFRPVRVLSSGPLVENQLTRPVNYTSKLVWPVGIQ